MWLRCYQIIQIKPYHCPFQMIPKWSIMQTTPYNCPFQRILKLKSSQMRFNNLTSRIINTITQIALHYQHSTSIENANLKFGLQMNTAPFPVTDFEAVYHRSAIPEPSPSTYALQPLLPPLGPPTRYRRSVLWASFVSKLRFYSSVTMGDVGRFWEEGKNWGKW